jgi:hypothetical protein
VVVYAIATLFGQRGLIPSSRLDLSRLDLSRLLELDDRIDTLNDTNLALVVITGVAFIVWTFRAAKNNAALGRAGARFGPGWAIAGWVIPIANLVIPVLIIQDLWRGSDSGVPRGDPRWKIGNRSLLVGFWWGLFLAGRVLVAAGNGTVDNGSLDDWRSGVDLQIAGNVGSLASAVVGIMVVRAITARQEECRRVQASGAPPPPPGS